MSLRLRVLLILLLIFVFYAAVDIWVEARIIGPSFTELERDEARKDLARCVEALKREVVHLDRFNHDWASWDDTFAFVRNRNQTYVDANLLPQTFQHEGLELIFVYNQRGEVVWGQARTSDGSKELRIADFPTNGPPHHTNLLGHGAMSKPVSGIVLTGMGALLVSARPILDSHEQGPARGTLVMGKLLDRDMISMLAEQTRVRLAIWPIQPGAIPAADRDFLSRIGPQESFVISEPTPRRLRVYGSMPDIAGHPALLIRATVPRDITAKGAATARFSFYSFLAISAAVLVVMLVLIQGAVIRPIGWLTEHAVQIGSRDDPTARLPVGRRDEIGRMALEFNTMLEKLADARRRLLDQSYYSGMSDLAAGVLHNVRNALSPLTIHIADLRGALTRVGRQQTSAAIEELQNGGVAAARRTNLLRYVQLTVNQTDEFCRVASTEVDTIARQTARIEEILADQERHSHAEQVVENIDLVDLAQEAVSLMGSSSKSALTLELDASLQQVGPVRTNRIALLQVIANLFSNAVEAGPGWSRSQTTVHVDVTCEQREAAEVIHLRVADDGPGIGPDILPLIFKQGFTTKESRRLSGLGLHWSANAMIALEGRLYAESEGAGKGACFHVIIPRSR